MYSIPIGRIATSMADVAYTSLNIMSMDVPKQVFVWPNEILKNLFPDVRQLKVSY